MNTGGEAVWAVSPRRGLYYSRDCTNGRLGLPLEELDHARELAQASIPNHNILLRLTFVNFRTAWLVYTLDSLASLDSDAVAHIETKDIRHIPLPYSNALWKATTAEDWTHAMMTLGEPGMTLDDGMYCMGRSVASNPDPLYRRQCGPYARNILILTILRGLVSYGQGQPRGGYVTRRWVLTTKNGQSGCTSSDRLEMHRYIIATYSRLLDNVSFAL